MRSPSTIVGFIEPVGTYIQSATAERNTSMRPKNSSSDLYSAKNRRRRRVMERSDAGGCSTDFAGQQMVPLARPRARTGRRVLRRPADCRKRAHRVMRAFRTAHAEKDHADPR